MIARIDALGRALEKRLGRIEELSAAPVPAGSLGAVLGVAVIIGGLGAFLGVLFVLVQLFA